jgi:hypothetical protein
LDAVTGRIGRGMRPPARRVQWGLRPGGKAERPDAGYQMPESGVRILYAGSREKRGLGEGEVWKSELGMRPPARRVQWGLRPGGKAELEEGETWGRGQAVNIFFKSGVDPPGIFSCNVFLDKPF